MGMVAQEFVDAAGEMPRTDFCKIEGPDSAISIQAMFFLRPNGVPQAAGIFSRNRPEGRKEAVQAVLPEREFWTIEALCARLELPYNQSERISLGKIIRELGWFTRRASDARVVEYTIQKPKTKSELRAPEIAAVASERSSWRTHDLLEKLGLVNTRSNQLIVAGALKAAGWTAKRMWDGRRHMITAVHYAPGRSWAGALDESVKVVMPVAATRPRWFADELAAALGWPANPGTRARLGRVMRAAGWKSERLTTAKDRNKTLFTHPAHVDKKPSAQS